MYMYIYLGLARATFTYMYRKSEKFVIEIVSYSCKGMKINCTKIVTVKNHENKVGMKTCKKTTLEWGNGGKERQEDYLASAAYTVDRETFVVKSILWLDTTTKIKYTNYFLQRIIETLKFIQRYLFAQIRSKARCDQN